MDGDIIGRATMFSPTPFSLANLAIDLLLMVALTYYLPRHIPRLFILLVVCNLAQYFIIIPIDEIPGLNRPTDRAPSMEAVWDRLRDTALEGRADALPLPRIGIPQLPGWQEMRKQWRDFPSASDAEASGRDSFLRLWMASLTRDPYALWLLVRVFWLGAVLLVFIQRPTLGAELSAFLLLPMPFLCVAVPYLWHWIQDQPWVARVQRQLEDPSAPSALGPGEWAALAALLLMAVGILTTVACVVRSISRRRRPSRSDLRPTDRFIRLNGNLYEFQVVRNRIQVAGLEFPIEGLRPAPDQPGTWITPTRTRLEFVAKTDRV